MASPLLLVIVLCGGLTGTDGFRVRIEGLDPHAHSLPIRNSCEGDNVSPAVMWEGPLPNRTRSFALTLSDEDSIPTRGFLHWSVVNISPTARYLQQNQTVSWRDPMKFGRNGNMFEGYTGPCNAASQHKYTLKLYAVSVRQVNLDRDYSEKDFLKILRHKILGPPAVLNFYFTGSAHSPATPPCDHPKQNLHGPPHAPDQPLPPITHHETHRPALTPTHPRPPRPDPAIMEAVNNDATQVGGGMSSQDPNKMTAAASNVFFLHQLHPSGGSVDTE